MPKRGRPTEGVALAFRERLALRAARERARVSRETLARRLNVSTSTIRGWEEGTRTVRDARLLAAWRRAVAPSSAKRGPVFEEDSDA